MRSHWRPYKLKVTDQKMQKVFLNHEIFGLMILKMTSKVIRGHILFHHLSRCKSLRTFFSCFQFKSFYFAGMATYPDGSRHLVITGQSNTTFIYDLDDGSTSWRSGPVFVEQWLGGSVQYGNTFLLVGGLVDTFTSTRDIYQFNPDPNDEKWILRAEKLSKPKDHFASFLVPNDYALC